MRGALATLLTFLSLTSGEINRPADAAGAVGPAHVVGVTNLGIVVQSRSGQVLKTTTLNDFWSDGAITGFHYFDSRIAYDASVDRWVLATLYVENFPKTSMLIAASANGDPSGAWTRLPIEVPTANVFLDFPRMAMTSDRFLITVNTANGSEILSFLKSDLYAGSDRHTQTTTSVRDMQPVTSDGADSYFLHNGKAGTMDLYRLDGSTLTLTGHFTTQPWQAPTDTLIAPQLESTNKMDVGDTTVQAAVARNGFAWAVHSIVTNGRSTIRWWKIALDGSGAETGTIDDGASFYAFPSIAVNRINAVLIGYCVFSAQLHPSMAYSYMFSNTTIANAGTEVPLQQRWGDFTTTVVDPVNDLDFWTTGLAANGPNWSTWWNEIPNPAPPNRIRAVRH